MSKFRSVRFDKLVPHFLQENGDGAVEDKVFDMHGLFNEVCANTHKDRTKDLAGDKFQLYKCAYDEQNKCWELQLLRLRDRDMPCIATENGDYQRIEIRGDQYVAESSTILYDSLKHEIYMQRNMHCVTPNSLARYIDELLPIDAFMQLHPVITQDARNKLAKKKEIRGINVAISGMLARSGSAPQNEYPGLLRDLFSASKNYGVDIVRIELGYGHKSGCMSMANTMELVDSAMAADNVSALKVKIGDREDYEPNEIDLLNDRVSFISRLEYSREYPITHDRLYAECLRHFIAKERS